MGTHPSLNRDIRDGHPGHPHKGARGLEPSHSCDSTRTLNPNQNRTEPNRPMSVYKKASGVTADKYTSNVKEQREALPDSGIAPTNGELCELVRDYVWKVRVPMTWLCVSAQLGEWRLVV